jgi:ribosomal protein S18 acetylase RimI-like enzyme
MFMIRTARREDAREIARIHIDMWRLAYAELLDPDFLRQLSYQRSTRQWESMLQRHNGVLLVAESADDGIVGFAAGGAERTRSFDVDGELMALYVLASHHRSGVGRSLVREMARELMENGRNGMVVWVLQDNPAEGFYEHLGATPAGEQELELGERRVVEHAYVWHNLEVLSGSM